MKKAKAKKEFLNRAKKSPALRRVEYRLRPEDYERLTILASCWETTHTGVVRRLLREGATRYAQQA